MARRSSSSRVMNYSKISEAERVEAVAELRKLLKPGMTVHPVLRHVSGSGMFRIIDLVIAYEKRDTFTTSATDKALKVGATAYTTTRGATWAFSPGKVEALTADSVTLAYQACATRGAESVTYPRSEVSFYKVGPKTPAVRSIGWVAAKAMRDSFDSDQQGIRVGGCGMDMGFNLVYNLGATLWPKGTKKPHGTRNGEPDTAGGYALKHRWL